jgi:hypothetical protein
MSAPGFLIVPQHVARNPIARAINRQKVRVAVAEFATRLHLLTAGEQCAADLDATARTLGVAAAVLEKRGLTDDTLAAGLAALCDMAAHECLWKPEHAGTLDAALQQAQDVFAQATAEETRMAWLRVGAA